MKISRVIILAIILVASLASCASSSWTTDPYSVVSREGCVAAVGYGMTMETAEQNAKVELASLFGSGVNSVVSRVITESDADRNGIKSSSASDKFFQASSVTIEVDNLYGIEIVKRTEKEGRFFALASMDKATTLNWYRSEMQTLSNTYESLLSVSNDNPGTLSSLENASALVRTVDEYNKDAAICSFLSGKDGDYIDASIAREILRNSKSSVVFSINWIGEEDPAVTSAATKVFSSLGLRIGKENENPAASININVDWTETKGTGVASSFVFAEYDASISVVDTSDESTVFVFTSKNKEGHQNIESAKSRALAVLSEEIAEELGNELKEKFAL